MTGYPSKKAAALDEEGMYLVHQTEVKTQYPKEAIDREMEQQIKAQSLAQPAQEPDVVMHWESHTWTTINPPPKGSGDVNLYYAAQRTWVGLTAEEAAECWTTSATQTWKNFEAKLKEKNT
jgi:hypothetical protein